MNASLGLTICRRIYRPHHGIARLRRSGAGSLSPLAAKSRPFVRASGCPMIGGHVPLPLDHTAKLKRGESMKKKISSPQVPDPPPQTWSNCLVVGNQVFVAGMVARDGSGVIGGDSMYGQAKAIFAKIKHLMEAAGGVGAHLLHGACLLIGVALVLPGVGVHVVAVDLPEAGRVDVEELEAAQPLGALPEVELGHDQAKGPAVIGREVLTVVLEGQH